MGMTHLLHELAWGQSQTDHRHSDHALAGGDAIVLAQGVINRIECKGVMSTIDLDHQADVIPGHVQVDPPAGTFSKRLVSWRGQTHGTGQAGEVELAQRVRAVGDITDDCVKHFPPR